MTISFWDPVLRSLWIAMTAAIIAGIIGTIVAVSLSKHTNKWKPIIETLLLLPLILPPSVVGFILLMALGNNGPIGHLIHQWFGGSIVFTVWAAVIAAAVVAFPLMYQMTKTGVTSVSTHVLEACRIDGANRLQEAVYIQVPLARRAILAGFILAFARSLGEFGATLMVAGNIPGQTQTLATAIYLAVQTHQLHLAWLWVGVSIGFAIIFLLFVRMIQVKK